MKKHNSHRKDEHPGWALQFNDGNWICVAHSVDITDDAFYAHIFSSEEEAKKMLPILIKELNTNIPCCPVVAWEPMCERLKLRIHNLEQANKISPREIRELLDLSEEMIRVLKRAT